MSAIAALISKAVKAMDPAPSATPSTPRSWRLTARNLVIRDEAERREFHDLAADLNAQMSPLGAAEQLVFDQLLHAAWNLHRFRTREAELNLDAADSQSGPDYDRLARHQARAERSFHRALKALQSLQTNRAQRNAQFDEEQREAIPQLASVRDVRKLTSANITKKALQMAWQIGEINYALATEDARRDWQRVQQQTQAGTHCG